MLTLHWSWEWGCKKHHSICKNRGSRQQIKYYSGKTESPQYKIMRLPRGSGREYRVEHHYSWLVTWDIEFGRRDRPPNICSLQIGPHMQIQRNPHAMWYFSELYRSLHWTEDFESILGWWLFWIPGVKDLGIAETLELKLRLAPVTSLLNKAHIRYRWMAYTKLKVIYKGAAFQVEDLDTSLQLLKDISIDIPDDFPVEEKSDSRFKWQKTWLTSFLEKMLPWTFAKSFELTLKR